LVKVEKQVPVKTMCTTAKWTQNKQFITLIFTLFQERLSLYGYLQL